MRQLAKESIPEILKGYSDQLSGTERDISTYRKLYAALTESLPKSQDGKEFSIGLLCASLLQGLLQNSIEIQALKDTELRKYLEGARDTITACSTLDWGNISGSLFAFGEDYRKMPGAHRKGYYVEIAGFKYLAMPPGAKLLGAEGQALPAFFDLDANLSDREIAPNIMKWYVKAVKEVSLYQAKRGRQIDGLCFVEKPYSDIGAVALMPYLVSELNLPATIYRAGYWNPEAKIAGQLPLPDHNYCLVYDVIGVGGMALDVYNYLAEHHGAALKGCVAFFDCDLGGKTSLEEKDIQLVSRVRLQQVLGKIESKTRVMDEYTKIAMRVPTPSVEQFTKEAKEILAGSTQ